MRQAFLRRVLIWLSVVLIGSLGADTLEAQLPGKGKGKGPKGPPPGAEVTTVRGTVRDFTNSPKGEVDGLRLTDGTWVHWPPHLEVRFKDLAR
jgi:hypothetical protein